jgi:predicted enzyme related to lactoylglutathione lyase
MTISTPAVEAVAPDTPPIATFDVVVLDTPDPHGLAGFYSALLGWHIDPAENRDDWVTIRGGAGTGIAFQLAPDHVPPTWPDNSIPQQLHLDVDVPDLDIAEQQVLAIGARATGEPREPANFRVYLDPAGHPFCLCLSPDRSPAG